MQKEKFEKFVNKCNLGIEEAKQAIVDLSDDECIELMAELEVKEIHLDKWNVLFVPFITTVIAALPLFNEMPNTNSEKIVYLAYLLLCYMGASMIAQCVTNFFVKPKYIKAKFYLECYAKEKMYNSSKDMTENQKIEKYEQIVEKQRKEREVLFGKWKEKQVEANKQVAAFEASLKVSNKD